MMLFGLLATAATAHATSIEQANALLDDWQLEDAMEAAQKILAERPEYPPALYLAGRVQHQRGEHMSALSLLEAAEEQGVEAAAYLLPLVRSSASYAAHFETLETDHFKIRYLNKDEIVAHYAGPVLEAAYASIGAALQFKPAERGEKIAVEIYPDARGLAGATGLTVQEIETSGTIAVCKFHRLMITSPLATSGGYTWADTLAHEFVHLVVSKKSKNTIPIWLHEGIAKYYESSWKGPPGKALGPFSEKLLAEATRKGEFITYDEMHPSMAKLPSQKAAALAFAEVFTTIEFLTKTYGDDAIPKVLALSAQGMKLDAALKKTFNMGLAGIERSWRRYLKKRPFREIPGAAPTTVRLATDEEEAQGARPLEEIADKEAQKYSRLGELLQLRGHHAAAIIEYEKAVEKAGVRYSSLVYRLARAYQEEGHTDKAVDVLDKSLTAHPEDADTHLLAGRIRFEAGDLDAAKDHFENVTLINPFNPEIHAALAAYYEKKGDAARAEQQKHFLKLASKPRPTRTYHLPAPRAGNAQIHLLPRHWGAVRLNGEQPVAVPLWGVLVQAGQVTVEYLDKNNNPKVHTINVSAGETKLVQLPAS